MALQGSISLQDYTLELDPDVLAYLSAQYGEDHFKNNILRKLKTPPAYTSLRINTLKSSFMDVLNELKLLLSHSDFEYEIEKHSLIPDCVVIRSTVEKQKQSNINKNREEDNTENQTLKVVLVDRFCGESVLRGSDIFVKGIISADKGITKGSICAIYAHVDDKGYIFNRGASVKSYQGHCVYLGTGIVEVNRSDMFSLPNGIGIKMKNTVGPYHLPPLNGVLNGMLMMQNIPSLIVPLALNPAPGDTVLDMCAAPGGKTSHLASLMKNNGLIVACDKSRKKMLAARNKFLEMGATCIVPLALDSTHMLIADNTPRQTPLEVINASALPTNANKLRSIKKFHPESFDKILLDPPCSALGLRPKLSIQWTLTDLHKVSKYQRQFIQQAVSLLKPGGTLTYSTCTINADENEVMVRWILDNFPSLHLSPLDFAIGQPGLENTGLSGSQRKMVRRFDPSDNYDTMGFFVSKFIKKN